MATYKGIKGFSIQNLSADPSNLIEGEMWYNSTSNVWKVQEVTASGTWASTPPIDARWGLGGAGTQTAGLVFGGFDGVNKDKTYEYDGSTWVSTTDLNTARRSLAGAGTQTAGLGFGGYGATAPTGATEEYDGSTWTSNPGLV
jgi:hypothetical protein